MHTQKGEALCQAPYLYGLVLSGIACDAAWRGVTRLVTSHNFRKKWIFVIVCPSLFERYESAHFVCLSYPSTIVVWWCAHPSDFCVCSCTQEHAQKSTQKYTPKKTTQNGVHSRASVFLPRAAHLPWHDLPSCHHRQLIVASLIHRDCRYGK